jgi:signal transduction histidine kinase
MLFAKKVFLKLISFGVYPQMEDNKKIAIQIASFDAIASLITFLFYFFYELHGKNNLLTTSHMSAFFLTAIGIYLIRIKKYDAGRILIHFVGLFEIYLSIDGVSANSGFEFYYFAPLIVPFVTFTPEELKKSIVLASCGFIVFIIQQLTGPGLFSSLSEVTSSDRVITIGILFAYIFGLFSISRWQMNNAYKKIKAQQSELIHISNIAALGEMSGGIAHEINNPLQILSTQIALIKRQLVVLENIPARVLQGLEQMDETVQRISQLVKGLRKLSRNVSTDPHTVFPVSTAINDMLTVSAQKLKHLEIDLKIEGDTSIEVKGHMVQLSQVFINLINNAVDAIDETDKKWIHIYVFNNLSSRTIITFTDSGLGISKEISQKIMLPFFTTKDPGKGTGLGLSISNSMIERVGGRLYYDPNSVNTKFVIELPQEKALIVD